MTGEPDRVITSTHNPLIVEARKLDQRKHRLRQDCFLVEGLQLLRMALDAGVRPRAVFFCEGYFAGEVAPALLKRSREAGAQVVAVSAAVMAALSERDAPQGLIATLPLIERGLDDLRPAPDGLVLVVDRLQDPGNLGTLIRTADAVSAAAVALIEPCVDLFDRKTVRATMGSLFNLPIVQTDDVPALFARLHGAGLRSVGADAHMGTDWGADCWRGGVALVLGNEARGLSEDVRAHVQAWARLPMLGRAESLNVAIAGGVLLYAWLRENWREMPHIQGKGTQG
ncbi:MAG: RNA methyltransferase, partial [Chloroflexota bacterium]